jgi:hypothetical protein
LLFVIATFCWSCLSAAVWCIRAVIPSTGRWMEVPHVTAGDGPSSETQCLKARCFPGQSSGVYKVGGQTLARWPRHRRLAHPYLPPRLATTSERFN